MQKEEAMNPETTPPRVFIQKSYEDARESCWAPKVSFKRIEESDYELISKPEVEALLAEARASVIEEIGDWLNVAHTARTDLFPDFGTPEWRGANHFKVCAANELWKMSEAAAQAAPVG
jgi:hypothetical protein